MNEPNIIALENVRALMFSRMQSFTDGLSKCQKEWNGQFAPAQMVLDGSARAHIINQYWYAFCRDIFAQDSGIRFGKEQFQRYIVIDGKLIIRFKLFDSHLGTSNYPTEHALGWEGQLALQGLPPLVRLNYGYRMNITGTQVRDAFVTLPLGEHNEWVWQTSGEPIDTFFGFQQTLPIEGMHQEMVYAYDNFPIE